MTQSLHDLCKTEDPDRYTVSVNGYGHADHPVNQNADVQGMNRYFGWYEKKIQDIEPWVEKLANKVVMAVLGASNRSMDSMTNREEDKGAAKSC